MTWGSVLFYILAAISVISALGVVLNRSPLRAALLLVVNFVCLAFFYLLLNAQVLALLQILVYAGAIMVLFLFVIMLLNLGGEAGATDPLVGQRFVGLLLGTALLAGLMFAISRTGDRFDMPGQGLARVEQAQAAGVSQIQIIGWDLFTRYVYPFELTSVLLLVGVVGVMILTKRRAQTVTQDASNTSS